MLQRIISHPRFVLADLLLVTTGAVFWMLKPELGIGVILFAWLPWGLRLLAGMRPFRCTPFDWLVAIFVVTAVVGYWAAYDKEVAWSKVWLIVLAVLLYYALAGQPHENLEHVCTFLFCIGVSVSIYFFLTHDFVALPRKVELVNRLGGLVMKLRPQLTWTPVHPNYVAGIAAITTPFVFHPARKLLGGGSRFSAFLLGMIGLGSIIAVLAIFMATSRGLVMAVVAAAGIWIGWLALKLSGNRLGLRREAVFPLLVLIFLAAVTVFLYAGPANSGGVFADQYFYGTGSRGELLTRSLYLVLDFPITGGGLAAFPGLYSYYMLGIPFLNVINSHNMFLDVTIEQGLLGGCSFLIIYASSIWHAASRIAETNSAPAGLFNWLVLFGLVVASVHGLVDDYLYNGYGTLLALAPAGFTVMLQAKTTSLTPRLNDRTSGLVVAGLAGLLLMNLSEVRATWNTNLGAVQMARVVLTGFPTNQWTDISTLSQLQQAESSLHAALRADPANRTANHRLGLISMLRRDFPSAVSHLESADREGPNHRGVVKALGYCYVWLGKVEQGAVLLNQIPEAREELDAYAWWWGTAGRHDLSENASQALHRLEMQSNQP